MCSVKQNVAPLGVRQRRGDCFLIYVCSFNVFAAKWTLYCSGSGWWCIMMKSWWSLEEWLRPRHLILRLITPIKWGPLLWFYSTGQLRHMFDKIGEISGFSSKTKKDTCESACSDNCFLWGKKFQRMKCGKRCSSSSHSVFSDSLAFTFNWC